MTKQERFRRQFGENIGSTIVGFIREHGWDLPVHLQLSGADGAACLVTYDKREQLFAPIIDPEAFVWPVRLILWCNNIGVYKVRLSRR